MLKDEEVGEGFPESEGRRKRGKGRGRIENT